MFLFSLGFAAGLVVGVGGLYALAEYYIDKR